MDGYERLAAAILLRAWRDAQAGNGHADDARRFLASEWCAFLADALDIEPGALRRMVADLPEPPIHQLELDL